MRLGLFRTIASNSSRNQMLDEFLTAVMLEQKAEDLIEAIEASIQKMQTVLETCIRVKKGLKEDEFDFDFSIIPQFNMEPFSASLEP